LTSSICIGARRPTPIAEISKETIRQKTAKTLTGHGRAKVAVLHNKAFPFDLTKINAAKGAVRDLIAIRRRRSPNGWQGAFKLKYDLRVQ
jgi:hypothetical protein